MWLTRGSMQGREFEFCSLPYLLLCNIKAVAFRKREVDLNLQKFKHENTHPWSS